MIFKVVSVGSSVEKRKRNHNHGHVNLTLDIPIRSYHTIYIDYHSRWDSDAPTRDDYNKPEHVLTNRHYVRENNDFRKQILSDSRNLPIRNFTTFKAVNEIYSIEGKHYMQYVQERKLGYSAVSEPLLDIYWERTNITAQYLSLLVVAPVGQILPVQILNRNCNSGSQRVGMHLLNALKERIEGAYQSYGSYVHQYHVIPGCEQTPTVNNGCMNGTITIETPTRPGDYRLQLFTLTNASIGNYQELIRRSFGTVELGKVNKKNTRKTMIGNELFDLLVLVLLVFCLLVLFSFFSFFFKTFFATFSSSLGTKAII